MRAVFFITHSIGQGNNGMLRCPSVFCLSRTLLSEMKEGYKLVYLISNDSLLPLEIVKNQTSISMQSQDIINTFYCR